MRHLDGCDPLAAKIGAVNTVVVRGRRKAYGYNTDYVGVLRALEARMPLREQPRADCWRGRRGACRGVCARAGGRGGLRLRRGAREAKSLARAVGGEAIARSRIARRIFRRDRERDAGGNASARSSESPLEARELNCRLVFDTIYRPRLTKLLQLAARRGIETVSGVEMFVAQGTAQWEIWTGERAPVEAMRRAVMRALARRKRQAHGNRRRKRCEPAMIQPDFKTFSRLAKQGNLVPGV